MAKHQPLPYCRLERANSGCYVLIMGQLARCKNHELHYWPQDFACATGPSTDGVNSARTVAGDCNPLHFANSRIDKRHQNDTPLTRLPMEARSESVMSSPLRIAFGDSGFCQRMIWATSALNWAARSTGSA